MALTRKLPHCLDSCGSRENAPTRTQTITAAARDHVTAALFVVKIFSSMTFFLASQSSEVMEDLRYIENVKRYK